ncbi:MAG TPA: GNAT family N-acetyltransferase [Candidatus Acidoferrum sp.]|nr:GNAT family N-acetyltransferase [Candidatus Acidoferrum sp.]
MDVNLEHLSVTHNQEDRRFELVVDGLRTLLTYRRFGERIFFDHTEVPVALEGKGLAAKLARVALDFARANHMRVVPLCPYVSSFIWKHPEYQDLLSPDDLQKLRSG